ncbi:hypothetical protein [Streptomyces melanosporofaciens]|uniref:hypothetical protein n=1 Tax=Streptomyces melanosporofaciens TaxID=67327 RepID=UPI00115FB513|nr:hypothetical protein [Streptomyces melanosporofaciens]
MAAPHLAATLPPVDALRTWMERFIGFMPAKSGMADALRVVLTDDSERLQTPILAASWGADTVGAVETIKLFGTRRPTAEIRRAVPMSGLPR